MATLPNSPALNPFEAAREEGRKAIFPFVGKGFIVQLYILSGWLAVCAILLSVLLVVLYRRRTKKNETSEVDQPFVKFVSITLSNAFASSRFARVTGKLFYVKFRGNWGEIILTIRILLFLLFLQPFIYIGIEYWYHHHLLNGIAIFLTLPWPFLLHAISHILEGALVRMLRLPLAPKLPAPLPLIVSISPFLAAGFFMPVVISLIVIAEFKWQTAYKFYVNLDARSLAAENEYLQTGVYNFTEIEGLSEDAGKLGHDYEELWKWIDYAWGVTALGFLVQLIVFVPLLIYVSTWLAGQKNAHHPSPSFSAVTPGATAPWTDASSNTDSTAPPERRIPKWRFQELNHIWAWSAFVGAFYTGLLGWIAFDSRPVERYENGFFEFYVLTSLYLPALASSATIVLLLRRLWRGSSRTKSSGREEGEVRSWKRESDGRKHGVVRLDFFRAQMPAEGEK
ncbi:hypothetical protein BT69DRAFT_1277640 [Atractiella rhizophila]|nr:hypothetical protein BT69DRAFT_1277640 [Atractiella rhizophila]